MKLKAILFDFDGTLVHSIDLLVRIFEEILAEREFPPVATEKIRTLIGEPFEKIFREITPLEDVAELVKDFRKKEDARNNPAEIAIVAETIPTLEFLRRQNLKLGVVSTKKRAVVLQLARDYHLEKFFNLVVGGEEIENPKPHPEPILHACELLGISPREILFVGDSLLDLQSAKAAGAIFVGVLTGVCAREEFEKARADYIFSHVGEVVNLVRRVLNNK
ncbi:HAD family hydrolase [Patescibacteria group bacterium]|nr:HAD family hydrolase [Patescibacteria group bacterium]